MKNYVTFAL